MSKQNKQPLASYPDDTLVLNICGTGVDVEIARIHQSGDEPVCLVEEGEKSPSAYGWGMDFIYTHIVTPDHPYRSLVDAYIATVQLGCANSKLLDPIREEPHHGE